MSDVGVGDSDLPYLDVTPADSGTSATLTVFRPDGTSASVPVTGGPLVAVPGASPVEYTQRWTADSPVVYDQPGTWVLRWVVAPGTGEGAEDFEVFVAPLPTAGGPTWLPGISRVAAYVPHRTLVRSVDSSTESADTYQFTFDDTTIPTGGTVARLISDGAAWVSSLVYPLNARVTGAAGVVTALYAAAAVERGWPQDDSSLQRALDLEKRMDALMQDLLTANSDANEGADTGSPVIPVWSFPPADLRWDYSTYW